MCKRFIKNILILFLFILIISACRSKTSDNVSNVIDSLEETNLEPNKPDYNYEVPVSKILLPDTIIGDTVWIYPYTSNLWTDTIKSKEYEAILSAYVDTNDYILDIVETSQGGRITIGFNHLYSLEFIRNSKHWFSVQFNKKEHLETLIGGTDFWLESNLNVFHRLCYNKTYGKFIIEFDINLRYNYGSVYYFVFDTLGTIDYIGTAGSWGGGDTDGAPFLTNDDQDYITSFEIYNFERDSAISVSEFSSLAEIKTYGKPISNFHWLYGLRSFSKNNFLLIYNREENEPEFNALILNTDTNILGKFRYYGLIGEMDAILLFNYCEKLKRYFLYDSEREILISINELNPSIIKEINLGSMTEVDSDTMSLSKYLLIDFDSFGSYRFFKELTDSVFYYDIEKFN